MNRRFKSLSFISIFMLCLIIFSGTVFAETLKKADKPDSEIIYNGPRAKYVFLFIGDGMGLCQVNSAEIYKGSGAGSEIKPVNLNFTSFPAQGLCTTYSSDSFITDSAAAATAIACGIKTNSGVISMDSKKEKKPKTIAEYAKEAGMKVGIVSSVSIDHATPACFYAHEESRSHYYEIACQIGDSGFDYFAGGGIKGNSPYSRKERKDVFEILKEKGYSIIDNRKDFEKLEKKKEQKIITFDSNLDRGKALSYEIDRKKESIPLHEFTAKGIELLDNDKGFFMMVEGGKIDWACHANDAGSSIKDVLALEESVKVALKFYKKHPEETLIIVVGDHETGGMTSGFAGTKYSTFFEKIKKQTMSYDAFSNILYKYKKDNKKEDAKLEDLEADIKKAFGLIFPDDKMSEDDKKNDMILTEFEFNNVKNAFEQTMLDRKVRSRDQQTYLLYGGYEPLTVTLTHILNNKAGIGWTSYSHTAVPVPAFAIGAGQDIFNGYYDNTDIAKKIMAIML
jgi:alkaline phosphatase